MSLLGRTLTLSLLAFGGALLGSSSGELKSALADGPDAGKLPSAKVDVVPPVFEDVEHLCALLTGCDDLPLAGLAIPKNFPACVRMMAEELAKSSALTYSLAIKECGLKANSCSSLRTCALRGVPADACLGRGKSAAVGYCDDTGRAVSCAKEKVIGVKDCPRAGEQCAIREGEAVCSLGTCPSGMKEGVSSCTASGKKMLRCDKGKLSSVDCSLMGLQCLSEAGEVGCGKTTASCSTGKSRCEGQVSVQCVKGQEVRIDCAAGGWVCGGSGGAVGHCNAPVPSDAEKKCDSAEQKCDGATIKYCQGGQKRSYFCKSLGFNKCVSDTTGAHCKI